MANTPTVSEYMTASPHSIGAEQTLSRARTVMLELGVRHLPVLHGGKLVGVVSDRDVRVVEALEGVDLKHVIVSDAMSAEVYSVAASTPLAEVASEMAEKRLGSALIVKDGKVVGIFTTVDACRALAERLRR
jgi:acetoin utilization protein AcuB